MISFSNVRKSLVSTNVWVGARLTLRVCACLEYLTFDADSYHLHHQRFERFFVRCLWQFERWNWVYNFFLANLIKIHPKMCSIQRFFYSIFSMIDFSWTFEPKEWWISEIGSTKKLFNSFNWTDVVEIIDYVVWWTLSKPLLLCVISNVALFFTTKIPLWKILKKNRFKWIFS